MVRYLSSIFLAVAISSSLFIVEAGAELAVAPTRVVFDARAREADVLLTNRGTEERTYRIELEDRVMDSSGKLSVAANVPSSAKGMIRFSPRQVRLQPGQSQIVRIQLRKPATLGEGEYRSHLRIAEVPETVSRTQRMDFEREDGRWLGVQLKPVFGISVPVIVRHGDPSASVAVGQVMLRQDRSAADLELRREGTKSVYGTLKATFLPAGGLEPVDVAELAGIALYADLPVRRLTLPLRFPDEYRTSSGVLRVVYEDAEAGRRILAEGQLEVP
jgi:P pilus assembly chaperone PapD